ncbi:MAG: enoyl-CoA hydratase/isomerase family protein [Deltaproteobacteria bacterium]|nr:enoyl-CoA hydratase/isomerase family protein [Deltaproteobacteria bacterium]
MIERPYRNVKLSAPDAQGALLVTLSNPARRNAIGPRMVNELLHVLADAADDPAVRTVVVTGEGGAFCAGGDFAQMTGSSDEAELSHRGDYADLMLAMDASPKPIIAKVNGHAMGGGLGLVAASHFAVASLDAKLGTPEIDVGLFPMMIMAVLRRHVSRRRLVQMMLFGEKLGAAEATAVGLVNRAVPADELDAAVHEVAERIAEKSPLTVKLGLEALAAQDDLALEDALPLLRERLGACLGTDDAREGLMAFLEKRKPVWTGR